MDITFDDEESLPQLNNLSTHISKCRKKNPEEFKKHDTKPSNPDDDNEHPSKLKQSADLMREYLRNGELNPAIEATQTGFLRLFAAWILDESLPWTTGEAPSLKLLFQYLKVKFILPTDTTVRNQLAKIFAELHGKVVREFTVRSNATSS